MPRRQRADAVFLPQGFGRVQGTHRHHLLQGELQRQKAGHHFGHAVDGVLAAGQGQIGADAVRQQTLIQHPLPHRKAEIHPPVSRIQPDAALLGLFSLGNQFALGIDNAAGIGGEQMGNDVPRLQDGQQLVDDAGIVAFFGVADMHHQLDAGFHGGPFRHSRHFHAHNFQGRGHHPGFDAVDGIPIFLDGLDGLVQVDAGRAENVRGSRQAGAADVQERDNFRGVVGDDVAGKAAVGVAAGTAGVHHRSNPGLHAAQVGGHAVAVHPVIDMGMQVNQAGGNDFARHFHHLGRVRRRQIRSH